MLRKISERNILIWKKPKHFNFYLQMKEALNTLTFTFKKLVYPIIIFSPDRKYITKGKNFWNSIFLKNPFILSVKTGKGILTSSPELKSWIFEIVCHLFFFFKYMFYRLIVPINSWGRSIDGIKRSVFNCWIIASIFLGE